jgi:hypothetical protein
MDSKNRVLFRNVIEKLKNQQQQQQNGHQPERHYQKKPGGILGRIRDRQQRNKFFKG